MRTVAGAGLFLAHEWGPVQFGGELLRARVEVAVVVPAASIGDRHAVGEHFRRPLEEGQRSQRLEVGGVAVKIAVVRDRVIGVTHPELRARKTPDVIAHVGMRAEGDDEWRVAGLHYEEKKM